MQQKAALEPTGSVSGLIACENKVVLHVLLPVSDCIK